MAESGSAPPKHAQADAALGMTKMVIARAPNEATAATLISHSTERQAQSESAKQTDRMEELHSDTLPRVGRYVLLRKLGEGGMGVVYSAYDQELDRKVALKIIHPQRQQDLDLRARIFREAQALARVSAPNVIHVYQVGEVDGQLFIAMEFVNGTTLSKWQSEPAHSWQDVLRMYIAAGQGLQAAHEAGLVHRDFKPDNVLIGEDGRPRVADFGLARIETKQGSGHFAQSLKLSPIPKPGDRSSLLTPLTQLGEVMGTPLYMSPEQHLGEPADGRSDQFSFCVALYEALYKQLPFAGDTIEVLGMNTISGRVLPRPPGSHVPLPVHEVLLRGLSPSAAQRFGSMRELLSALAFDPAMDPSINDKERRRVLLSMTAFVVLAAVGLNVLQLFGIDAIKASLINSLAFFAVFAFLLGRFRRGFLRNTFHRVNLVYGLAFSGQLIGIRLLGIHAGLTVPQMMVLDLIALASTTGMTTSNTMPGIWPVIPLSLSAALVAGLYPVYAQIIASVAIPLSALHIVRVWVRTTTERHAHRRRA